MLPCYAFGQGSATGCYTQNFDNAVHTRTNNSIGVYANNTGKVPLSPNYCSWTPTTTGTTCRVCPGFVQTDGSCRIMNDNTSALVGTVPGFLGTFTMVLCPLDDYIILLILLIGGIGFSSLRNTKMMSSI